jgi:predicted secreted hydrolase
MLTEWWYYTGHLFTEDGRRFGFEFVFFQANRGAFPASYAAHFAITDNAGRRFEFAERVGINAIQPTEEGFSLALDGWSMRGALGFDELAADMPGYAIDLVLNASKAPVLHNEVGYIDLGPVGGSYYYTRSRMAADGTLTIDGEPITVTGIAWMDHQWGNFIITGLGGWDWFAVQLDNDYDLALSQVRDDTGNIVFAYGTLVDPDGDAMHLPAEELRIASTDTWTSPATGITYPSRWIVELPSLDWQLTLTPTLPDQELDTQASTRVIYWEGEVLVEGVLEGVEVSGLGYVELTGYE